MNEQKNNGRGIFYGVIGVATLVVAIIGATFAYFTATQSAGNNVITGNMATISFGVVVEKVVDPGQSSGMIPMSNTMVETAVNNANNDVCVDDNGNSVCQIYKITVTNTSSAAMFVDGYIALTGGSGNPTDYPTTWYTDAEHFTVDGETVKNATTMRWAQVFKNITGTDTNGNGVCETGETNCKVEYSTAGTQTLGYGTATGGGNSTVELTAIGKTKQEDETGKNIANVLYTSTATRGSIDISGSNYATIAHNYIRVSNHDLVTIGEEGNTSSVPTTSFDRTDVTSTLVLSQQLQSKNSTSGTTRTDIAEYYFMVWLSETGTIQNATPAAGDPLAPVDNRATSENNFFNGVVTFNSAQGSEVTATFTGYAAVTPDTKEETEQAG